MYIIAEFNPDTKSLSEIVQAFERCSVEFQLSFVDDIRDYCGCMVDKNVRKMTTHHFRSVIRQQESAHIDTNNRRMNGNSSSDSQHCNNQQPSTSTANYQAITKPDTIVPLITSPITTIVVKEEPQDPPDSDEGVHIPSLELEYRNANRDRYGLSRSVSDTSPNKSPNWNNRREVVTPLDLIKIQMSEEMEAAKKKMKEKMKENGALSTRNLIVNNDRYDNITMDQRLQELERYQRPPKTKMEATCQLCNVKISLGFRTVMHGAVKLEHAKMHMQREAGKEIADHDVNLILLSEQCFPFETDDAEPNRKKRK